LQQRLVITLTTSGQGNVRALLTEAAQLLTSKLTLQQSQFYATSSCSHSNNQDAYSQSLQQQQQQLIAPQ
jgi:hypothetical protein